MLLLILGVPWIGSSSCASRDDCDLPPGEAYRCAICSTYIYTVCCSHGQLRNLQRACDLPEMDCVFYRFATISYSLSFMWAPHTSYSYLQRMHPESSRSHYVPFLLVLLLRSGCTTCNTMHMMPLSWESVQVALASCSLFPSFRVLYFIWAMKAIECCACDDGMWWCQSSIYALPSSLMFHCMLQCV